MEDAELVAHWDRMAGRFDQMIAPMERRVIGDAREWVGARAEGRVLELAIGTGLNLPHYPAGVEVTGIEWSPAMLAKARARADALGLGVELIRGDAAKLPFDDASFDTVVCTLSMCCIPDDDGALAESFRVLHPAGRLLLVDHVASTVAPVRWGQRMVEHFTIASQGEHFTRRPLPKLAGFGFDVVASMRQMLGIIERVEAVKPA